MLKECNTESFYYRCVPYSFIAGGLAYAAVSKGNGATVRLTAGSSFKINLFFTNRIPEGQSKVWGSP